jgi:hypothetical protein
MVAESIRRNNRIAREGSPPSPFPPSVAAEEDSTLLFIDKRDVRGRVVLQLG